MCIRDSARRGRRQTAHHTGGANRAETWRGATKLISSTYHHPPNNAAHTKSHKHNPCATIQTITCVILSCASMVKTRSRLELGQRNITPLWGGFPSSITRQPRGCQYRTTCVRKARGEMFAKPSFLVSKLIPTVEISSTKNRSTGV